MFYFGRLCEEWAVKAPPTFGKGGGDAAAHLHLKIHVSACFYFCWKVVIFSVEWVQRANKTQEYMTPVNDLWGILSWNFTDIF